MAEKRIAVVTGAARGIGRSIVMALLARGREVVGLDLNNEQLKELETVAKEAGYSVKTKCVDITNIPLLKETLESIVEEMGRIDILVNNAGITRDKLMMQMEEDDYDRVVNVNLKAAFMATAIASKFMVRNKFGRILNISSVAGVMGQAGSANYAASKAGLIGMTKSVAREIGKKNVTANCIAPGFIQTDMTAMLPQIVKDGALAVIPMKKFGNPEDVANAVAFLTSDEAGFITGQVLCVDGGMAM